MTSDRVRRGGSWYIGGATSLAARAPQARPVPTRLQPRLPLRASEICNLSSGGSGRALAYYRVVPTQL